ncbi:mechanosensitive ion channel family protein [Rhizobium sp. CNPSo 3464]|uniref:mechanosensitive ion channel family protein n=1 Tax=Rhizobium sp. CNPSo 3464 TaxID=3021406 RepID=UPI00254ADD87|nr:mechanosensitive ion channel family protein [Rhizobium sp. CNPSo 3464]MDK4742512.1 mechanosensitive ion channel family protein [Rhizobium sp. CNPSo 3464]
MKSAYLAVATVFIFGLLLLAPAAHAQQQTSDAKVDELVRLLQDPDVKAWLDSRKAGSAAAPAAKPDDSPLADWDNRARSRYGGIVAAIPTIPGEIAAAMRRGRADAIDHGYAPIVVLLGGLVLLGAAVEAVFRRQWSHRASSSPVAAEFLPIAVFTAAMAIVFFVVDWPPLVRIVLLTYLIAFVAYRCLSAAVALATPDIGLRRRIKAFAGLLFFAIATATLGPPLGVPPPVNQAISFCFSIFLFALALEAVWTRNSSSRSRKLALSLCLFAVWLLWLLNFKGLAWLGIFAMILPPLLRLVGRAVERAMGENRKDLKAVVAARGSRAVVIAIAIAWLAMVWHLNPDSLAHQDPTLSAITYGLLKSAVVLLVADLVWHIAKAFIDSKLQTFSADPSAHGGEAASEHRIATLLPIFRNALAVFVLAATALTVLAELGVQIGPLIAGAGIFGVALGFGSQTLVKDVISGIFYMLDDAFRVGEYIQSGSYKGTVESFSLRSVRLRHHRGPIFTVPFGALGAVQNMSRDWVIDKFMLRVAFDTDIAMVKKLVKTIGAEMKEDPELAPFIIEPVKMKGVEQIGEFGIELSFAFTTVPGHQSAVRRRAYTMIRDAFRSNGIEFAQPTVQVGGEEKAEGSAAVAALRSVQLKQQATEVPK